MPDLDKENDADAGTGNSVQSGFQLASFFGDRIRGQLKRPPEIEQNIRGTPGGVVGQGFSPQEITELENRVVDAANPMDALTLSGLQAGVPVTLSTNSGTPSMDC